MEVAHNPASRRNEGSPARAARRLPTEPRMSARQLLQFQRCIAYLERVGAVFMSIEGHPNWFVAHWHDPDYPTPDGRPTRWACSTEIRESDLPYALEFQRRAAASGLVERLH